MRFKQTDLRPVPPGKAYELLNTGGLVLVCTVGADGVRDLAPIAWSCPLDYEPTSRVMIVLDPGHKTSENIDARGSFVLALPSYSQRGLVEQTGSVSGREGDKYGRFGIAAFPVGEVGALVPEGAAGYLECRVIDSRRIGSVVVYSGEVVSAAAVEDAWRWRLHYAGGETYYKPGPAVDA
jgi:flavin reductase (DIM6/NTAB) family NADH-FMN oxidoreductase RutF